MKIYLITETHNIRCGHGDSINKTGLASTSGWGGDLLPAFIDMKSAEKYRKMSDGVDESNPIISLELMEFKK